MKTEPLDIIKLSHYVANRFNKLNYLIEYDDRVSIASLSMYQTLSYIKDEDTKVSSRIVVGDAIKEVNKMIQKKAKELSAINNEFYRKMKTKNKTVNISLSKDQIRVYLSRLTELEQEIILMRFWGNKSWLAISKSVNRSSTNCRQVYLDCLKKLRRYYPNPPEIEEQVSYPVDV